MPHPLGEAVRLGVGGGGAELRLAPDRDVRESAALDCPAPPDPEPPRRHRGHARHRRLARHSERPQPAVELRHGAVGARVRMVGAERTPRRAQRRVGAGDDPLACEDLVEVRLAHPEEERAGAAAVKLEDAAD